MFGRLRAPRLGVKITRLKFTRRRVIFIALAWPIIILLSIATAAWQMRVANLGHLGDKLPEWTVPTKGQTLLVFAPHCDDETLSSAGLMQIALRNGADVWVVLMTNGDGFRAAIAPGIRALRPKAKDFVSLGYRRQEESFASLRRIGVRHDHILTFGYPDRGLEKMWVTYWNQPLRSAYTRDEYSPYADSYTRNASYTGSQVLDDIVSVLVDINPDMIILPYPSDQHSDHWGTSIFVSKALYDLGWWDTKRIGMYLCHRGDWPVPQGMHPNLKLVPPAALTGSDTKWYELPLDERAIEVKNEAMKSFVSQPPGTRRFISSFVRRTELFAVRRPEMPLQRLLAPPGDWAGIGPVVLDGRADGLITHAEPSADITAIYAARDAKRIYFRIELAGRADRKTVYQLRVHSVIDDSEPTTEVVARLGRPSPKGWNVSFNRRTITMSRDLDGWLNVPLVVTAGTKISIYQVDRTAYRILTP